jgi:hypothetical protein
VARPGDSAHQKRNLGSCSHQLSPSGTSPPRVAQVRVSPGPQPLPASRTQSTRASRVGPEEGTGLGRSRLAALGQFWEVLGEGFLEEETL